jgi:hypothetical protein
MVEFVINAYYLRNGVNIVEIRINILEFVRNAGIKLNQNIEKLNIENK